MLVARYASGIVGCAEVMAPMVRWRCQRQGSIASLERGISYLGVASNDYFCVIPKSADGIFERGGFLRNPHSLPRASCAKPFTHVLAQASLDEEGERRISA